VKDTQIYTDGGGDGGRGGDPQSGGLGGTSGPEAPVLNPRSCPGGHGGRGGDGGFGGGGLGGPSIGIAYLDEDRLTLDGVTFDIKEAGKGGYSSSIYPASQGEDGIAAEKMRFAE
jgi:hypothetical protein